MDGGLRLSERSECGGPSAMALRPLALSIDARSPTTYTEQRGERVLAEDPSWDAMPLPTSGTVLAILLGVGSTVVNVRITRDSGAVTLPNVTGSFFFNTTRGDPVTTLELQLVSGDGRFDFTALAIGT